MQIRVTHDDGESIDITALVTEVAEWSVYDMHKLAAEDIKVFAALARACRYRYADNATEIEAQILEEHEAELARRREWLQARAARVVDQLRPLD